MMTKKALSLFLALLMLLSATVLLALPAAAEEDDISWVIEDETLYIYGKGEMSNYFGGAESRPWHSKASGVKKVAVCDGITSIGSAAFTTFVNLEEVVVGKDVTKIGMDAFSYNGSLTSITFNGPIEKINQGTVYASDALSQVTITGQTREEFLAIAAGSPYNDAYGRAAITVQETGTPVIYETAPVVNFGDVNDDGTINKKDSLALKKYLADDTSPIDLAAADVNGDGDVNKKDSLRLKQYLAGWDVGLGHDHESVVDAAVAPTCLKNGLTEGSHCAICGKIFVKQTVVPSLGGHNFEGERCTKCGKASYDLLAGKTALFLGDSLCMASTHDTAHQWWGWAGRIAAEYDLASYKNVGVDGASVSNCRGSNTVIAQLNNNKNGSYDFLVIEGSTNDAWDSIAVGSMTAGSAENAVVSSFNLSTFAGGLENLFYYAKKYYPNACIGYVFNWPMNRGGTLGHMEEYLAVAKQICEKWDIPMLNFYESADFQLDEFGSLSAFLPDGVHPSSKGYDALYPVIGRFMAEILLDSSFKIYDGASETSTVSPVPYGGFDMPDKETDPQGWLNWLVYSDGKSDTPIFNRCRGGSVYNSTHEGAVSASPWELYGNHLHMCYQLDKTEIDASAGVNTAGYGFIFEIWYRDAVKGGDYKKIETAPWSVYIWGGSNNNIIYRIPTYSEGMNDMALGEGETAHEYEIVIVIYEGNECSVDHLAAWKYDSIYYSDSTEMFIADANAQGII